MLTSTLLLGSILGVVIAFLWIAIGVDQARPAEGAKGSRAFFALFWIGIGIHALVESGWAIWMALSPTTLAVGFVVLIVKITTAVVAFMGLVAFMLLVYTGRRAVLVPVGVFYAMLYPLVLYDYVSRVPIATETRTWYAGLQYALPEGTLHMVVAVLMFLPPLVATAAYGLLYRVARSTRQRRRVIVTALGLGVFFIVFLFGWVHERWYWWGLIERGLALGTAIAMLRVTLWDSASPGTSSSSS